MFGRQTTRALVALPLLGLLAGSATGCGWWEKRKTRKELEDAQSDIQGSLEAMKAADAKVLKARDKLRANSKGDTDQLVEIIHDYSTALQDTVDSGKKFADAVKPVLRGEPGDIASTVMMFQLDHKASCGHEMKLDEIDTCGGAWGKMVAAANAFGKASAKFDVTFPTVREADPSK